MATKRQKRDIEQADLFNSEEGVEPVKKLNPATAWPFPITFKPKPAESPAEQKPAVGSFYRTISPTSFECRDAQHNAPSHLWIPESKEYVHICSTCKAQQIIRNNNYTLQGT